MNIASANPQTFKSALDVSMIEIRGLTKSYGDRTVFKGIDLDVNASQMVVVIDPSDSGRSISLRCCNGLRTAEGGIVNTYDRRLIDNGTLLPNDELNQPRQQADMMFQLFNLFSYLSMLHNVTVDPRMSNGKSKHEAEAGVRELLQKVGLAHEADVVPASLPGGQKQRMAIACALVMQPKVTLFGESTSIPDPELVGEALRVMKVLVKEGMMMLVVAYEMGFAHEVANMVVTADGGGIIKAGPSSVIFGEPKEARTRSFLRTVLTHA